MTEDVIIVSLGARFKGYCANVARTYVIDAVPKVEATYNALVRLQAECLACMQPGARLSEVYARAHKFLESKHRHLLPHLPKSLGFSLGLDFKDPLYAFTAKTDGSLKFKANMVFNLAVGFQDVELTAAERAKAKGAIKVRLLVPVAETATGVVRTLCCRSDVVLSTPFLAQPTAGIDDSQIGDVERAP
jgi:nucleosome binding factor SPN SPT16 subunit